MRLNLTKPLVGVDLEATGLDLVNDRIIQITYVKVSPGDKEGEEERKSGASAEKMPLLPVAPTARTELRI